MDERGPLALLTVISHMDNEELLEIRLETWHESGVSYILIEGRAASLMSYTELFKDYYVELIKTITDREEKVIYIQVIKGAKMNGS